MANTLPPALFSPRWFRILGIILKEAQLGGRILCRLGIHRWSARTEINRPARRIKDYNWCQRPFCRYHQQMVVNEESYRI